MNKSSKFRGMHVAKAARWPFILASVACVVGCAQMPPPASMPDVPMPATFRGSQGPWIATDASVSAVLPSDTWWTFFGDPSLNALEEQLTAQSPDLAVATARYQQARALTDSLRSAQSPTIGLGLDTQRIRQSELRSLRVLGPSSPDVYNSGTLGLQFQYELDLWGRVSQRIAGGLAQEQASVADLAAVRTSLQAELAETYFALRGTDREAALFDDAVHAFERAADMTERRHRGGIASGLDLARAQAQLEAARSQARQVLARRALLEHAIAALVGENPSGFSLVRQTRPAPATHPIPTDVPSVVLQRRPDIKAAQQRVAAANVTLGLARTAYFPDLRLNASAGFQSSDLERFVRAPNIFWAIGPSLLFNLMDGGARAAETRRAEAALDEVGQRYRAVVLNAFREVEDQLALVSRFGEAVVEERRAGAASERALALAMQRYEKGAVSYLEVIAAQSTALQSRRAVLDLETRQRRASVQLIRALGGGWDGSDTAASAGGVPTLQSDSAPVAAR